MCDNSKVIRPLDGYELGVFYPWISITDILVIDSFSQFKKNIETVFKQLPVFNLAIQKINGKLFWVNEPFVFDAEEIEWDNDYENMKSSSSSKILVSGIDNEKDEGCILKLYQFKYALKEKQCIFYMNLNHAIIDGRSIFDAHSLVKEISNAKSEEDIKKIDLSSYNGGLCKFGQADNYNISEEDYTKPLEGWNIPKGSLLPAITTPASYINEYFIYDMPSVKSYTLKHNVSIQPLLMVVLTRAARRYNLLNEKAPVTVHVISNTRKSKYAKEEIRQNKMFCRAGALYSVVKGQSSTLEDIKHCAEKLATVVNSPDACIQIIKSGKSFDESANDCTPITLPFPTVMKFVVTSNLGRTSATHPKLNLHMFCGEQYSTVLYSYYNDSRFYLMFVYPNTLDNKYIQILRECISEVFETEIGSTCLNN